MRKIILVLLCLSVLMGVFLVSCEEKIPKEIDNPSSEYVVECLKKIPLITKIEAVTERNDPNGNLNKQGGYTAQVFFSYALVDQEDFDEESVIDKGTDCGGSVEVYRTEKEAKKRDTYLSSFDGGVLASGSHTVIGTVVVRTSCKLTASQQRSLEYDIIAALKGEDDKINKVNPYKKDFEIIEQSASANLTPQSVIDYLKNKDYSKAEINYILDNCDVNWGKVACWRIEAYAKSWSGMAKNSVRNIMITEEGFSEVDCEYGLTHCKVDWVKEAEEYLINHHSYTKEEVVEWYYNELYYELIEDGFSETEAKRALETVYGL